MSSKTALRLTKSYSAKYSFMVSYGIDNACYMMLVGQESEIRSILSNSNLPELERMASPKDSASIYENLVSESRGGLDGWNPSELVDFYCIEAIVGYRLLILCGHNKQDEFEMYLYHGE